MPNEHVAQRWREVALVGSLVKWRGSRIGLYRNRHALELGQRVECARAPISDLLPGDELGRGRSTDGVKDTNVGVVAHRHDAGDRCAHLAPGHEPGT